MTHPPVDSPSARAYNNQSMRTQNQKLIGSAIDISVVLSEPSQVMSGESLSVENSKLIFSDSTSSRGSVSSSGIRMSFQSLLSVSERVEHKEKRGYFISEEMIGWISNMQSNISNVGICSPLNHESSWLDLDLSSFIDKSERSIRRLDQEMKGQIQLLLLEKQAEKAGTSESGFEKKEQKNQECLLGELSHDKSNEPLTQKSESNCSECNTILGKYKQLLAKYNKLKLHSKKQSQEKEHLKQKVQRAGEIARK